MINSVQGRTLAQVTLTAKEHTLLTAIIDGMDEPGCGWLHELAPETKETAGILGSLVKKGFATSHQETTPGYPPAHWVQVTPSGQGAWAA
jgi:hypothetical protein